MLEDGKELAGSMDKIIGSIGVPLDTRFAKIRTQETNASNWIADIIKDGAENAYLLRSLYMKTIILPRQARDKHRERSKRDAFSAGTGADVTILNSGTLRADELVPVGLYRCGKRLF